MICERQFVFTKSGIVNTCLAFMLQTSGISKILVEYPARFTFRPYPSLACGLTLPFHFNTIAYFQSKSQL